MVLMVFLSSRISPFTSTVILRERSPRATAVVTSAMLRTWAVRLPAMEFTLSVKSFQVPATPGTCACPPSLPSVPTSRATRVTSAAKALSWSTIVLSVSLSCRISPLTLTVIFFDRSPGAAAHQGLTAQLAFGTDLAGDARHLAGERVELVHHGIDGVLELGNFAAHVDGDLFGKVAAGDGGCDFGDVADLRGQVRGHGVDAVGQVFPGAGDAEHVGLAAQPTFGTDLARHARHLAGKRVELIDHRVDGFLELQDFAAHVHGDLLREIAAGDGGGDVGDVADLRGQVRGHRVDAVGQILPRAGDARHHRLTAELAFGADLARHARHFRGKRVQLVHHRVDGVLELENLAAHVHRDLARQVAARDRRRHLGDVAHLVGEVAAHGVHRVGQILPSAGNARHDGLAAELAFGADLARHARHLRGEHAELLDHGIDDVRRAQEFALQRPAVDVEAHRLQQIALGDGGDRASHFRRRPKQIIDEGVDRAFHLAPGAVGEAELHALACLSFAAHDLADTFELLRHALVGGDDLVEGVGDLAQQADLTAGHAYREVPHAHGRRSGRL